jgi:ubiquitin carboxyl-terminal hydrolase 48
VPRDELSKWFKGKKPDDLARPFDYGTLLCAHGGIDPVRTGQTRLISDDALSRLKLHMEIPILDICELCIEDGFAKHLVTSSHGEQLAEFEMANDTGGEYAISKIWLSKWKKGEIKDTSPIEEEYSILCEHDSPWDGPREMISAEAVGLLRSIFGDFTVYMEDEPRCAECTESFKEAKEAEKAWAAAVKVEKAIRKQRVDQFIVIDSTNYVLPPRFLASWQEYLKEYAPRPALKHDLCRHGMLDLDPEKDEVHFLTEEGWKLLCRR